MWPWEQVYADRIAAGLEHCRVPGCTYLDRRLFVAKIDHDRDLTPQNATILCAPHRPRHVKGGGVASWRADLMSLRQEERARPIGERWSVLAEEADRAADGFPACPLCGRQIMIYRSGRFGEHYVDGVRCVGSAQTVEHATQAAERLDR